MRPARLVCAQLLAFVFAFGVFAVNATACEGGGSEGAELTSLATRLSGGGKEGESITVSEGTKVTDKATLSGKNASKATGKVAYKVYSEKECKTLVASAGEVTVSGESVPASSEETLEAGRTYYWQAHYGGDAKNDESTSPCTEILTVQAKTSLATKLSGESKEAEELTVLEGAKVKDTATLSGANSSTATGKVLYKIYSDKECKTLVKEAGEVTVTAGSIPASSEETLEAGKTYYWQATYKGDTLHQESTSTCGKEVLTVKAKTALATKLSGESKEAEELTVLEGAKVKDTATLSGTNSSTATGKVLYKIFSDKECKTLVKEAGEVTVTSGSVPASTEEVLEAGKTYYWQATYKGDTLHQESTSTCGKEVLTVKAKTTLVTKLSGESKEAEELTVLEGAKVNDKATLSGTNSSTATGKVKYAIYSDKECKTLVKEAGEVTVTSGSIPASTEETLEAGKTYYWQATYKGDTLHQESTSTCGKEVLTIKAKTTLATKLSGESKEAEELTVLEGTKVNDKGTLSGTNSSTATGKVLYKIFSDKECKTLVKEAGEVTVTSGSVPASAEEVLEAGKTYYWQATYKGDTLHQESTSTCGKEILNIKAKTTLSTTLSGEETSGEEIAVQEAASVVDNATLHGKNTSSAAGTVTYKVYSDSKCEHLVSEAGEVTVSEGVAPESNEEALAAGLYYWQAAYSGDSLHQASTSTCGEIDTVKASTTVTTSLSAKAQAGEQITVGETAPITDKATLGGVHAAMATGTLTYYVYSDTACSELVAEAGHVTISGEFAPASSAETLPAGTYYWRAVYSGDSLNHSAESTCSEVSVVTPSVTTSLTGEGKSGEALEVLEGSAVSDKATLNTENASIATGKVKYKVYKNEECTELATEAGEVTVSSGVVPASSEETLAAGTYYWQASYSGDSNNPAGESPCGSEVEYVQSSASIATSLSGEGKEGSEITVQEGAKASDKATLSGTHVSTAEGAVKYAVYSDSECKELVVELESVSVSGASVPKSEEVALPVGIYYWQAEYSGDALNHPVTSTCGSEILVVSAPLTASLSGEAKSGPEVRVEEGAVVSDQATLHTEHASTATGKVTYDVYSDRECKELVAEAGEVTVSGASEPASSGETLPAGEYFWQATYSGDAHNPAEKSACGTQVEVVWPSTWRYAALGDSFSSGEGVGGYYANTNKGSLAWNKNMCHRSNDAYPAWIAYKYFGGASLAASEVYKQVPPRFVFRACSGAVIENLWGVGGSATDGQYNEFYTNAIGSRWAPTPSQDMWITAPGGIVPIAGPVPSIYLLTATMGGNDAGFATIVENCIRPDYGRPSGVIGVTVRQAITRKIERCKAIIKEWETGTPGATRPTLHIPSPTKQEGIPSIPAKLRVVLEDIRAYAPNAAIRIPLYPEALNLRARSPIPVAAGMVIDSGGPGSRDVALAIERFLTELNRTIEVTVEAWAREKRVNAAPMTATVTALQGHRLGDATPWINGVALPWTEESFHPNCNGHKAMAEAILRVWQTPAPGGWSC